MIKNENKCHYNGSWNKEFTKDKTKQLRNKHIAPSIQTFFRDDPLKIVKGNGQYLYDENGVKYLDCINNVAHVGHSHPCVLAACSQQMAVLNTNSRFLHDNVVNLAQQLTATLPEDLSVCYFVNSGSEANDLALRIGRSFTKSEETIVLENAYHGHVISCISISPYKYNKANSYEQKPEYVHEVSTPDFYRGTYQLSNEILDGDQKTRQKEIEKLTEKYIDEIRVVCQKLKQKNKHIGIFILESIQSCGGQLVYPVEYWKKATKIIHEHGGIVIADEVQTGFGRVGSHFWAFQLEDNDVVPDIITMGKPMGNGYPIAAVVTNRRIAEEFRKGPDYFNTFGGNPVSCAVALAVLDTIRDEKLQENAKIVGEYLLQKLHMMKKSVEMIGHVRGIGLFIGVDLVKSRETREPATNETKQLLYRLKQNGIVLSRDGPYDNVLKIKPPMCFSKDDADYLLKNLVEAFSFIKQPATMETNKN